MIQYDHYLALNKSPLSKDTIYYLIIIYYQMMLLSVIITSILIHSQSYPTTITSQYNPPSAFLAYTFDFFRIDEPTSTLKFYNIYKISYHVSIAGTPDAIATVLKISDSALRTAIDFKLQITSVLNSQLEINLNDAYQNSHPTPIIYGEKFTVNILVFDKDIVTNIQYKYYLTQYAVPGVPDLLNFNILPSTGNVITSAFIVRIQSVFSGSNTIMNVDLHSGYSAGTTSVWISYIATTSTSIVSQLGVLVLVIISSNPYYVLTQTLSSTSSTSSSLPYSSTLNIWFTGLVKFSLNFGFDLQILLDVITFTIIRPSLASPLPTVNDYVQYKFLIFQKPFSNPPNIIRDFQLSKFVSYSLIDSTFILFYQNIPDIGHIDTSQVQINHSFITVLKVQLQNNILSIICSSTESIKNLPIQVKLKWIEQYLQFQATTNLTLDGSSENKALTVIKFCEALQYIYLIIFVFSLLATKLVGIEMMSLIQLAFYSQIPLNTINQVFLGLSRMQYVSGYNMKFPALKEASLSFTLKTMGFSSNFMSNINIMLFPLVVCPAMFGILLLGSKMSKSYKHKPRMRQYAIASLCEWLFTSIVFIAYSIYTSLMIDFKNLGKEDPLAIFISVIIGLLPITLCVVYCFLKHHYNEFAESLNQHYTSWNFKLETSKFLSNLYPIVLASEAILIPLFLGAQSLESSSLYITMVINIIVTIIIIIILPYFQGLNNIRLLVQRSLNFLMILLLIISKENISIDTGLQSPWLHLIWMIIALLILGLLINIPFIVWKFIVWVNRNGIIDMKMFLQYKGKIQKRNATIESENPMLYPTLQYGIGRQALLDKQNGVSRASVVDRKNNHKAKNTAMDQSNI